MKKEFLFISLLFLLPATQFLKAQSDSLNKKFLRIYSINVGFGPTKNQVSFAEIEDYKKMAPQDSLTNISLAPYKRRGSNSGPSTFFSVTIGFNRLNKKTNQYYAYREHRVGVRFYSNDILQMRYNRSNKYTVDTLTYKGKGYNKVEIDSTVNFYYAVQRSNMMFDFGTIYHSRADRLLKAYVGYNIGLGFSYSSLAHAEYDTHTSLHNTTHLNEYLPGPYKIENSNISNSFMASLNFNWGINWRLARTRKVWSKIIFNAEYRWGCGAEHVQRYGNCIYATMGGYFGLKVLI